MQLTHTLDREWKEQREASWQTRLNEEYWERPKKEIKIHRDFYFQGDLQKYLNSFDLIRYNEVACNYPAETLDQFKEVTKEYWRFAYESEDRRYFKQFEDRNDEIFYRDLGFLLVYPATHHSTGLFREVFYWVFGNRFEGERTLDIGLSEWHPTATPDPRVMVNHMGGEYMNICLKKNRSMIIRTTMH